MYYTFHCLLSHCNFHVSLSLLFIALEDRRQTLLIKRFNFVFTKDLPSISQSNVQAATAKNEEQYTLNNMIYIKLQNCRVSFFEAYFEGGTPKMYINQLKDVSNEVHFF